MGHKIFLSYIAFDKKIKMQNPYIVGFDNVWHP
jgi:hypothetical protein